MLTGKFRPKEPGKIAPVAVYVKARVDGSGTRFDFASAMAIPRKEKDGYWSYRVQIVAPAEPRQYDVEVTHLRDLVAIGKLNVE